MWSQQSRQGDAHSTLTEPQPYTCMLFTGVMSCGTIHRDSGCSANACSVPAYQHFLTASMLSGRRFSEFRFHPAPSLVSSYLTFQSVRDTRHKMVCAKCQRSQNQTVVRTPRSCNFLFANKAELADTSVCSET